MKKIILIFIAFISWQVPLFAKTIFIYIEEIKEGEISLYKSFQEAIFSGLFDRGHIVFDDNGMEDLPKQVEEGKLKRLFYEAEIGGAELILLIKINSFAVKNENGLFKIKVRLNYFICEVNTAKLLTKGELISDNFGQEEEIKIEKFGMLVSEELLKKLGLN